MIGLIIARLIPSIIRLLVMVAGDAVQAVLLAGLLATQLEMVMDMQLS